MTLVDITRRLQSARALLNELQDAELHGVDSAELHALAATLEFNVTLLEAEVEALRAV